MIESTVTQGRAWQADPCIYLCISPRQHQRHLSLLHSSALILQLHSSALLMLYILLYSAPLLLNLLHLSILLIHSAPLCCVFHALFCSVLFTDAIYEVTSVLEGKLLDFEGHKGKNMNLEYALR
jgi:hypothetical protein